MRIALVREFLKSWKMTKEMSEWRKVWFNAKIELQSDNRYLLSSTLSIVFTLLFLILAISMCMLNIYGFEIMSGTTLSFIMAIYYSNKKLQMIDDVAVEIIQNGLTSR